MGVKDTPPRPRDAVLRTALARWEGALTRTNGSTVAILHIDPRQAAFQHLREGDYVEVRTGIAPAESGADAITRIAAEEDARAAGPPEDPSV